MNPHQGNNNQGINNQGSNVNHNNINIPQNNTNNQRQLPQPRFPIPRTDPMLGVAQHFSGKRSFEPVNYTPDEFVDIQTSLDKTLGPEYISSRPGGGGSSVSYLEGWKLLNLANEIFGFNGWSSELVGYTLDFCDILRDGRISIGLLVVVRVTIKDGTFHEDIGYGFIENAKSKAAAFEKCKKEALTDGLKRCLRCFGNVLGNCLYDKTLSGKLRGIPKTSNDLDASNIYRDGSMAKLREERRNVTSVNIMPKSRPTADPPKPSAPVVSDPATMATPAPSVKNKAKMPSQDDDSFLFSDDFDVNRIDDYEMEMILNKSDKENQDPEEKKSEEVETGKVPEPPSAPEPAPADAEAPSQIPLQLPLFVSAKKAEMLQSETLKGSPTADIPQFDPQFISPNIRRTLDPSKSVPVKRSDISTPSKAPAYNPAPGTKRMIGMPPQRGPLKRAHKE